ncbi:MAG: hypothetical protein M3511_12210, partial [Deinococcota bacterium]|nr:hypothetical protein [Deinococcota bacterium]
MSKTVDDIQQQLSPEHLKEQAQEALVSAKDSAIEKAHEAFHNAKDNAIERAQDAFQSAKETVTETVEEKAHDVGEKVGEWSAEVVELVKNNPVPAAVAGLGLGWFLVSKLLGGSSTDTDMDADFQGRYGSDYDRDRFQGGYYGRSYYGQDYAQGYDRSRFQGSIMSDDRDDRDYADSDYTTTGLGDRGLN